MDNNPNEQNLKRKRVRSRLKKDTLIFLFIALFLLALKSSFYEPFRIPSGSMLPTLKIGDFIVVNKMSYGLKVPFSDLFFPKKPIFFYKKENSINRGDIIVFKFPKNLKVNYIKRVIGLPGDKIKIVDKNIYLNDNKLPTRLLESAKFESKDLDPRYRDSSFNYYEVSLDSLNFNYQLDKDNYFKVDYDEVVVPDGEYFVLGDNRDFSNDSRYWGFVPRSYIKGKAEYIWLSIGKNSDNNHYFFRFDRFGVKIK